MTSSFQVHSLERLPSTGALIIPGRLDIAQTRELLAAVGTRNVTWLAEDSTALDPELQIFLEGSGKSGAAFSKNDSSLADIGKSLESKISGSDLLIFVPGKVVCLPATACQIPGDTLSALCQLGLPISPLDISVPSECLLSVENTAKLPTGVLNFGEAIPAGQATVAKYREALLSAYEESFSKREFFNGSLTVALIDGLKMHGQKTTLFDGTDDSELNYDKILGVAIALSKEIKTATKKKRVGILLPPGKGGMVANLAVLFAGKIPVNLNFTASREAVQSSIRQAGLDKFITADPFVRKIPDFPWPPTRDLIFIERILPQIKKRIMKWVVLSKILPTSLLTKILGIGDKKGDDEAILLFTSGSSGEPKGVPLSHRNLLANVTQFGSRLNLDNDAKLLGCLPLFHSLGCTVTLWYPVIEGINLVTYPSPLDNKRLAELIYKHKIDLLLSTPTFLRGYMRRIEREQLASLKFIITGAEKLPNNLAHSFEDKFGKLPMEGYGLTETAPGTNVNLPLEDPGDGTPVIPAHRPGSVGPTLPGIALKITNAATDEPAELNESGIIWIKGQNVFQGYLDKPDLTKDVLKDGWFKSGDVGRVDDDGFLYIEGRISRFSKIAGEMVPHETVEAAVNKVLGLDNESERKIAIVGVPDEKKGEAILLLSTIAGNALEQEALDIRYKLLDDGLPSLWCPKVIIPIDEIPVLASGKLDIKACQALVEELR
jgi:acyl-[acyl-carrier-protein]-phospholipid O-acyltransferase/long-chain-fatty-acid--[acyl-carrier-protein] ligase